MPPPSGVDITTAEFLVGIGWGIKDASNIPQIEELAKTLGGTLACSRPIVDKGWPPNDRQVGSSGKTIKPKLYIALGISGAFQHVLGMKSSDLIIAVNEDSKAARALGTEGLGDRRNAFNSPLGSLKFCLDQWKEIKGWKNLKKVSRRVKRIWGEGHGFRINSGTEANQICC